MQMQPNFQYEGKMHVDATRPRDQLLPGNRLEGTVNVLIFASTEAAPGARNILKLRARGSEVGPILIAIDNRAHKAIPLDYREGLRNKSATVGTPVAHYS